MTRLTALALAALALTAAACDNYKEKEPPKYGSLTRTLTMVDAEGRNYGTVELDPINGGRVMDAQNRLIGRIVSPVPDTLAPTVSAAPLQ